MHTNQREQATKSTYEDKRHKKHSEVALVPSWSFLCFLWSVFRLVAQSPYSVLSRYPAKSTTSRKLYQSRGEASISMGLLGAGDV